jgi:hypothetical protein
MRGSQDYKVTGLLRLLFIALLSCYPVILSSCSALPSPGAGKHPPKYSRPNVQRFDDWFTEINSCVLTGNSPEVRTTTNGGLEGNTIELRLHFAVPLARQPRIVLNSLPIALRLEGANQDYTVQLPYSPTTVAHYMQGDSYLTVSYMPANADADLEVSFSTSGLVSGVTYLARTCH